MSFSQFIALFSTDPVNLSLKGKLLAVLSCLGVIFSVAALSKMAMFGSNSPILVASMGASAVIVFIIPNSPLAQPWSLVGGQFVSALAGMSCALFISDVTLAATLAVGSSVLLMLLLRCLHPPGAATALAPVMGGQAIHSLGYSYTLFPVGINVMIMLILAVIINRYICGYNYPALIKKETTPQKTQTIISNEISQQEIAQVLANNNVFIDVTATDLSQLLNTALTQRFKQTRGNITCKDIMQTAIISVEYGTEVEEAWQLMLNHHLNAITVIDKAQRVIGIVTQHDFLKFINLTVYTSLAERLQAFIRRTPDMSSQKPESVGHIMNKKVITLFDTCHIVELIPLMSHDGHRQIPIINAEQRLVGMVSQAQLIAALYAEQLK